MNFRPVTLDLWDDMQHLFSKPGAQNGCWCMWWRVTRAAYREGYGDGNKEAMRQIIAAGEVPGILAYIDGEPMAWCSVAPREVFASLERSPTLRRVDDAAVWSIVCFVVAKEYRGAGVGRKLIDAAVDYAIANGAAIVEAYPLPNEVARDAPGERYMGVVSTFEAAGFVEVLRRSPRRVIMRYTVAASEPDS